MNNEKWCWQSRSALTRCALAAMLAMTLAACGSFGKSLRPAPRESASRAQLSVGYSLLYQEADGIPKLKWLLALKDKHGEMGQLTQELIDYYEQLAANLQRLARQFPGVHIDAVTMPQIEADARKALGEDSAKSFAPLVGNTGLDFERDVLLMLYDALNEQRHLVGVMVPLETDPGLQKFLETTKAQLDVRYMKVGALLNRHYFTH